MVGEAILAFLGAIDAELVARAPAGATLDLYLLGRSALILGYGLRLMTKDVDVVASEGDALLDHALKHFGKGSPGRSGHPLYLESVSSGLPPLPQGFRQRGVAIPGPWRVLRPSRLEAHDLVVTKLRRFHGGDREDIRILCDTGEIAESVLRERFAQAHLFSDLEDPSVVRAGTNLQIVVEYLEGRRASL